MVIFSAMPATKPAATNKSQFIRSQPATLSPAEVVAKGKAAGLKFNAMYVYNIRRAAALKGRKTKPANAAASKATTPGARAKKPVAVKKTAAKQPSKSEFIRAQPRTMSASDVVSKGKAAGLKLDASLVYKVRARARGKKGSPKAAPAKAAPAKAAPAKTSAQGSRATTNGNHNTAPASSRVEHFLRAAAAELGLPKALEVLHEEWDRVRKLIGS